jgi:hypothetical protein
MRWRSRNQPVDGAFQAELVRPFAPARPGTVRSIPECMCSLCRLHL